MKNLTIKKGDRVNVQEIITESWQSEKSLLNGFVYKVEQRQSGTYVTVLTDKKSINEGLAGGVYSLSAFKISILK